MSLADKNRGGWTTCETAAQRTCVFLAFITPLGGLLHVGEEGTTPIPILMLMVIVFVGLTIAARLRFSRPSSTWSLLVLMVVGGGLLSLLGYPAQTDIRILIKYFVHAFYATAILYLFPRDRVTDLLIALFYGISLLAAISLFTISGDTGFELGQSGAYSDRFGSISAGINVSAVYYALGLVIGVLAPPRHQTSVQTELAALRVLAAVLFRIICVVICGIALANTGSVTGFVTLLGGALFGAITALRKSRRRHSTLIVMGLSIFSIAGAGLIAVWVAGGVEQITILKRVDQAFAQSISLPSDSSTVLKLGHSRGATWLAAANVLAQHPITGGGAGFSDTLVALEYNDLTGEVFETRGAHNTFLTMWLDLGVVGFVTLLALTFRRSSVPRPLVAITAFIAISIGSLAVDLCRDPVWWTVLAIWAAAYVPKQRPLLPRKFGAGQATFSG